MHAQCVQTLGSNSRSLYNQLESETKFKEIINQNFAAENSAEIYFVAKTPVEAIEYLINYKPSESDITEKWLKREELRS